MKNIHPDEHVYNRERKYQRRMQSHHFLTKISSTMYAETPFSYPEKRAPKTAVLPKMATLVPKKS